ncbi:hypothetical protein M5J15_11270 [Serratia symbiotica]|uniref:hypothetical protein n=1 Tax=Serratia symbiotica TaxID=138074 RepID=UPI002091071F|nr:hypothetical protein [Serratia symbiotica]USS95179.1 hypothetical protein M5J15_11270 [Serratia symbiotica]
MSEDKKVEFNTSDVLNALLHRGQNMQHLATQESVDNLRRESEVSFNQVNRRFEQVDKRFDKLENKLDRLQWFIVGAARALIFKDYLFKAAGALAH